jgi:molybdopterin converting factor small subunit
VKLYINLLGTDVRLKEEVALDLSSPTLKHVLRALKDRYKGNLQRFINHDLSPTEGSAILLNGRNILSLDPSATKIQDGDELTFTVLVAGG